MKSDICIDATMKNRNDHANTQWENGFAALVRYVSDVGHALPPHNYTSPEGFRLGQWVTRQRNVYRAGNMLPSRVEMLNGLDGWHWERRRRPSAESAEKRAAWQQMYETLKVYVEAHETLPHKRYVTQAGAPLGEWVRRQRRNRGHLSQDRLSLLESLSAWAWSHPDDSTPRMRRRAELIAALQHFAATEGHANVPSLYRTPGGLSLGSFVARQRHLYRKGLLSQLAIQELEGISGWAWTRHQDTGRPEERARNPLRLAG